jgi:branched-chain amino acid transport system permease protein
MDRRVRLAILACGAALAAVPWLGVPAFYESFLYLLFHWIVLAVSWNILSGYSGYFSFGHGAYFGTGIYVVAFLAGKSGWPFLASLPAAALVAAALGVALGAVVFRVVAVRGELFALLTLAVTFVIATIVLNTPIDGGPGVYLMGVDLPKLGPTQNATIYLMGLIAAVATVLIAYVVHGSKFGAGLFAIHDDEDVAEAMGVPTYRFKLLALGLSCALAGIAGGIHAVFVSYVTVSEVFSITVPLSVVLMSALGGSRQWYGPAIGAVVITCLLFFFTSGDGAVIGRAIFGLVLVLVILFMPEGVAGLIAASYRRMRGQPVVGSSPASEQAAALDPPATRAATKGETLLRVEGLSKAFKGVQALQSVTLEIKSGEILGLVGPNGSGKSTFINVVSGFYRPEAGRILFEGHDLVGREPNAFAHAGIARTYQIPRPLAHMTVVENVAVARMFGGLGQSRPAALRDAEAYVRFAGLTARRDALPDDLNLHQRKFLELARALAARPKLLLLDEVLSGLTPTEIDGAIEMIRRIRDQGTTIVFVEHIMRAVVALADRIVVFNHGALIAEGKAEAVMNEREVRTAYLGAPRA